MYNNIDKQYWYLFKNAACNHEKSGKVKPKTKMIIII